MALHRESKEPPKAKVFGGFHFLPSAPIHPLLARQSTLAFTCKSAIG